MTRNNYIDYAKALCVILVVFIHTGFSSLNDIILFAMPVFFAATGFTFSFGKRSITQNISQRFRSVMLPYFMLMLFYTLIEIARANLFGYGDTKVAYGNAYLFIAIFGIYCGICFCFNPSVWSKRCVDSIFLRRSVHTCNGNGLYFCQK